MAHTAPKDEFMDDPETLLGEVSVKDAARQVWLVKIPKYLNDVWTKGENGTNLGFVSHNTETDQVTLTIPAGPQTANLPKEYNLLRKAVSHEAPMLVFSEDDESSLSVEGTVNCRGDLEILGEPPEEYIQLIRGRSQSAQQQKKMRTLKKIEDNSYLAVRPVTSRSFPGFIRNPRSKDQIVRDKKDRMPREELIDLIFLAFDRKKYWDFKSLLKHTDQPQAYLKEILGEICVYNKRGPNRSLYELKPEYRGKKQETTTTEGE